MALPQQRQAWAWLRGGLATLVVLSFWGALARDLWPEVAPVLLQAAGSARQSGAEAVPREHLEVWNRSTAGTVLVREIVARLEADWQAIASHVGRAPSYRVPVLIADGQGPALTDGTRLLVYHDRGQVDLSTASVLLAVLGEGGLSVPGLSLFAEGSHALYVAEASGRTRDLLGETTDAWVVLMVREGTLLSLAECREVGSPRTEGERAAVLRALIEGASLMRWLAEMYGEPSLQALRDGQPLEDMTGLSITQIEGAWLGSLAGVAAPPSCLAALPDRSPLQPYCDALAP